MILIVSPKGGVGSTTLSQNLAVVSSKDYHLNTTHIAVVQRGDSRYSRQALRNLGINAEIRTVDAMLEKSPPLGHQRAHANIESAQTYFWVTRAGLSQERLGVLAGVDEMSSSARMNQYEKGKHEPDFSMVQRIAMVLKVPESYFYAVDDEAAWMQVVFHRMPPDRRALALHAMREIVDE